MIGYLCKGESSFHFNRNPETFSRPMFQHIYECLCHCSDLVLKVPDEALLTHPLAGTLSAPIEAGEGMYSDLQRTYIDQAED